MTNSDSGLELQWAATLRSGEKNVTYGIGLTVTGAIACIGAVVSGDSRAAYTAYGAFAGGAGSVVTGMYQISRGKQGKAEAEKARREVQLITQQLNARVRDADGPTREALEANGVDLEMAERQNLTTADALVRSADEHDLLTGP